MKTKTLTKNQKQGTLLLLLFCQLIALSSFTLAESQREVWVSDYASDVYRFTEKEINDIVDSIYDFENLTVEKANELYRKIEAETSIWNQQQDPTQIDLEQVYYADSQINFNFVGDIEDMDNDIYINTLFWTGYSIKMFGILDTWQVYWDIEDEEMDYIDEIDADTVRFDCESEFSNEYYIKGICFLQDTSNDKYVYIDLFTNEIRWTHIIIVLVLVLLIAILALALYYYYRR
ncbi:MAG: hypothetical protein GF311_26660 [Candidatus Lokiarchaeota archaeon]|nr:hypothetical protein [Candidatus Lokiarchaeota archaeon]